MDAGRDVGGATGARARGGIGGCPFGVGAASLASAAAVAAGMTIVGRSSTTRLCSIAPSVVGRSWTSVGVGRASAGRYAGITTGVEIGTAAGGAAASAVAPPAGAG